MISREICLVLLLSLFGGLPALAQERAAWSVKPIQPNASIYWVSVNYFEAQEEFAVGGFSRDLFRVATTDETTFPVSDARFFDRTVSLHYEYGYSRKLTLVARLGFRTLGASYTETDFPQGIATYLPKNISSSGFDDLWVWGRYELLNPVHVKAPLHLSAQIGIKLPTGDVLAPVPLGTGVVDYDARLLGELTFYFNNIPAYLFGDVGFRLRGGDYLNQGLYRVEFGLSAAPQVNLRIGLSGIASIGNIQNLIGIGEIPRPAETRPLNVLGDERFGQAIIGLQSQISTTFGLSFDYNKRLYGNATFIGDLIQFSVTIQN